MKIMRKRNIKKQIWLDVKEDELLKRKSKEAGLSEAEFIRSLVKGYRIKAQPTEDIKSFQRDLYGIANNINQIAKVANSRYSVSHDDYKYISNTLADFILRQVLPLSMREELPFILFSSYLLHLLFRRPRSTLPRHTIVSVKKSGILFVAWTCWS